MNITYFLNNKGGSSTFSAFIFENILGKFTTMYKYLENVWNGENGNYVNADELPRLVSIKEDDKTTHQED